MELILQRYLSLLSYSANIYICLVNFAMLYGCSHPLRYIYISYTLMVSKYSWLSRYSLCFLALQALEETNKHSLNGLSIIESQFGSQVKRLWWTLIWWLHFIRNVCCIVCQDQISFHLILLIPFIASLLCSIQTMFVEQLWTMLNNNKQNTLTITEHYWILLIESLETTTKSQFNRNLNKLILKVDYKLFGSSFDLLYPKNYNFFRFFH